VPQSWGAPGLAPFEAWEKNKQTAIVDDRLAEIIVQGLKRCETPGTRHRSLTSVRLPDFHHHYFDRLGAGVHVGIALHALRGRQPVRLASLPIVSFRTSILVDDFHRATNQRNDDAWMLMRVHGQGCIGWNYCFPDCDIFVVKLWSALHGNMRGRRLRRDRPKGRKNQRGEKRCAKESSRHGTRYYHSAVL